MAMADLDATGDKAAGKVKETLGKVTGDKDTEAEGRLQNLEGKAKEAVEDVKSGAKALVDRAKDALDGGK
jgi:uncharacterized protein YjbJ (UPF0337 family)